MGVFSSKSKSQSEEEKADTLRKEAALLAEQRNVYFSRSQQAFREGRKHDAKLLSDEGKKCQISMEKANTSASDLIFSIKNKELGLDQIDLHGLFVAEAEKFVDKRIQTAKKKKIEKLVIIVGAGNHSENGIQRIKPAIEDLLRKHGLQYSENTPNKGCLLVDLASSNPSKGWCAIS